MAVMQEPMTVQAEAGAAAPRDGEMAVPGITVMTAEELGAKLEGPAAEVSAELRAAADQVVESYRKRYAEKAAEQLQQVRQRIGEPTHVGYPYWDLLSISPIQVPSLPPYQPSKIIASGEVSLFLAVLFINPTTNANNPLPGTTVLGNRGFRIRFEQIDLTNVTAGPAFTFVGTFPATAPVLSLFPVLFVAPDPGVNPRLVEQNVTADITDMAQPFAAFATNVVDVDDDPGFLGIPPVGPRLEHDVPLRYLIYRK